MRADDPARIERQWLHDFATTVRATTLSNFEARNSCIVSTRLGLMVLEAVGIKARAQAVHVLVMNLKAWRLSQDRVPVEQWPDDAWSVGVNDRAEGTGWSGHLVVMARTLETPRLLIDITADQFDRPARDMVVGGPVIMGVTGVWTPRDPLATVAPSREDPQVVVEYTPVAPGMPTFTSWRETPDWLLPEEPLRDAARRIVEGLGTPQHPVRPQ